MSKRGCWIGYGILLAAFVVVFLLIQLVPYGRNHTNPPGASQPKWNSLQTLALARRACFDCHSNETIWPWYSNIAPVSWLVQHDVDEGRSRLNFSTWAPSATTTGRGGERGVGDIAETINRGSMPPFYYLLEHPAAHLTPAEKQQLILGLQTSLGQ
ncbi:MAG TPA: heme-binding domain-containing protein [Anaerolineaceae bacterium]|nr:heme-binding domain-containing protein [Anaerolineaceae bacterium]